MVNLLTFYSDDPSSNPIDNYSYSVKFVFEKNKNKQKRGWGWPIFRVSYYGRVRTQCDQTLE